LTLYLVRYKLYIKSVFYLSKGILPLKAFNSINFRPPKNCGSFLKNRSFWGGRARTTPAPKGFCFEALNARGFAARRLRRPFNVYQASQADNRSFLTIDLDACGLRCPRPAQATSKAAHALH